MLTVTLTRLLHRYDEGCCHEIIIVIHRQSSPQRSHTSIAKEDSCQSQFSTLPARSLWTDIKL
jgi:hypothetical protein